MMMTPKQTNSSLTPAPTFLAVDFFCGAGGTTRGLIDAGGYVIAGVDKDNNCKQTYVENNANRSLDLLAPRFLERDIFPLTGTNPDGEQEQLLADLVELIPEYRSKRPDAPLMFSICAPCQPFTKLSRSKFTQARMQRRSQDSNLLLEASKFIKHFSPELVLSENVAGIKQPRYGDVWQKFHQSLKDLGYVIGTKVVCTSKFGVAQHRKRSILLAVRKDLVRSERCTDDSCVDLLVPESDPDTLPVSVRNAICHLPPIKAGETHSSIPNHRARTLSEMNLKRLSCAKPGEANSYLAKTKFGDLTLNCHRKVNERLSARCFTDVYTRMHPDRPSPTITTKCHSISNGRFGHFDETQVRGISLREAAILQSFPDEYVFFPTDRTEAVARMIGNAVPPKLALFFARYLVNTIELETGVIGKVAQNA